MTVQMVFGDGQPMPEREILDLQLEFCVTSLFGKLGSAQITYNLTHYDR
jgi:hypothetical protein